MGGAVVDEVGAGLEAEVLLMGEDDALMEHLWEVLFDPIEFILQGRGVVPRGSGEDIAVVFLCQSVYCINGTRHGLHQREQSWDVVIMRFALGFAEFRRDSAIFK